MRELVEALCSDACAGRRTATEGNARARALLVRAFEAEGLTPKLLPVPKCGGTNVIAMLPGRVNRWVLVGAHYDHLGADWSGRIYRGANDNAAAVGVLLELAKRFSSNPVDGRGVILAAFDAEEPPHYATAAMGSQAFVTDPPVPRSSIDLMLALELVGCDVGGSTAPPAVRDSLFVLGAERSLGTAAHVDALAAKTERLFIRRADAEIIPPLSDHLAFWEAGVPFALITGMRSSTYHSVDDTPAALNWARLDAVADFLDAFVRGQCARAEARFEFRRDARDDRSTLETVKALLLPLAKHSALATQALGATDQLMALLDANHRLPSGAQQQLRQLVASIEESLA